MWPMPLSAPVAHRSVSTGRPDSACSVIGVMKRQAAAVITTSTRDAGLDEEAREFGGLVRGDAAGEAQHDAVEGKRQGRSSSGRRMVRLWSEVYTALELAPALAGPGTTGGEGAMRVGERNAGDRPRERLLARGADALSDAELVSLLLGHGVAGAAPSTSPARCWRASGR